MALGLHIFNLTTTEFLNQLHHFDSVTLNKKGEFVCWIEGSCNFYIIDDVLECELEVFSNWIAEQHLELRLEKLCEKCGSTNTIRTEHANKAFDDRDVKGKLQQVQITEYFIEKYCNNCGHTQTESF